ncbi:MAG: hypothetical protein U0892_05695 [Pirellulales bacterium]
MKFIFNSYLLIGCSVCMWYAVAAYNGWRFPRPTGVSFGSSGYSSGSSSYGRSFGGSWGGGK